LESSITRLNLRLHLRQFPAADIGEPISQEVYDLLSDAGSKMKFPTSAWENLKTLIP
jgi:hypothetical protein